MARQIRLACAKVARSGAPARGSFLMLLGKTAEASVSFTAPPSVRSRAAPLIADGAVFRSQ
jgi:hypothetical protein